MQVQMKLKVNDILIDTDLPINGYKLIEKVDPKLLKKAALLKCNDKYIDLCDDITEDGSAIKIIMKNDSDVLDTMRHSSAHLMAQAVKLLFDDVKIGIGPVIENGFYYDFLKTTPFSEDDLLKIENKMKELIHANIKIEKEHVSKHDALNLFEKAGEILKVDLIKDLNSGITVYKQGDFTDLCRGPHLPSTGFISENFKLTKLSLIHI